MVTWQNPLNPKQQCTTLDVNKWFPPALLSVCVQSHCVASTIQPCCASSDALVCDLSSRAVVCNLCRPGAVSEPGVCLSPFLSEVCWSLSLSGWLHVVFDLFGSAHELCLSFCLSFCLFVCLCVCLSVYMAVCLCVYVGVICALASASVLV